jgi:hypothetical protein
MTDMEGRERCRAVTPMGPKMADLLVAYLEQLGCDTFQGYLVSKPVPPQLFTEQFLTAEKVI